MPSFEVFTTPDHRIAEGRLSASRPVQFCGIDIENLVLEFRDGQVESFTATRGAATFARLLRTDAGAKRIGEFAFVDLDTPIARSGLVFGAPILDENAASHIALGHGYIGGLQGGGAMSRAELEEIGCNQSAIHLDIPFGGEDLEITVETAGRERPLVRGGRLTGNSSSRLAQT